MAKTAVKDKQEVVTDTPGKVYVKLKTSTDTLNAKIKKSGSLIKSGRYSQKAKDREREGRYEGAWNHPGLPRSEQPLFPEFCSIRKKFQWAGTNNELNKLIKDMQLRYPDNYRVVAERGSLIPCEGDQMHRLSNYNDPVFNHPDIRGFKMTEGTGVLNLSIPMHKFIYLTKKNELSVSTESTNRSGASVEFRNLKVRNKKQGKTVKIGLKAASLLNALADNDKKLIKLANIMNVPGTSEKSDPNIVLGIFDDIVIRNTDKKSSHFEKNYRDLFIYLAELDETEFEVHYKVYKAMKSKKLIKKSTGFEFIRGGAATSTLIGVTNKLALYEYLIDDANSEFYIEFVDAIK